MSFFHSGQPCLSISCCHLGPNTFFCISGLLIPIGKTPKLGRSGKKRMTIRKDAMLILCVGRTIVASGRLRRISRSVSHREALLAENAQVAQSPNRTNKLLSLPPVESHRRGGGVVDPPRKSSDYQPAGMGGFCPGAYPLLPAAGPPVVACLFWG